MIRHASRALQKKPGWVGTAWEYCVARPLTGRPKTEAQWTMVAEHSELRFIQRNGVFFEDNEGAHMFPTSQNAAIPISTPSACRLRSTMLCTIHAADM